MQRQDRELTEKQREKFHRLLTDASAARHRSDAISAERQELREQKLRAQKVLERAEGTHHKALWTAVHDADIRAAKEVLRRWEMLEGSYRQAAQESGHKRAIIESTAKFLIKKGVDDPMIREAIETLNIDTPTGGQEFTGQSRW